MMDSDLPQYTPGEARKLREVVEVLRDGREQLLRDWIERVRDNRAIEADEVLSEPLLLDSMPQLFDAIVDRLEIRRDRADTEYVATIHGFSRRVDGYNVQECVIELLMFRRAIWAHLTASDTPVGGAYVAMEQIDGMVDRAIVSSLRAFLDPNARVLEHQPAGWDDASALA